MTIIKIEQFNGTAPKISARKLAPTFAQEADNCDLFSGELRSINSPSSVGTASKGATAKTIYRMNGKFLNWNEVVSVAPSALNVDDEGRIYFTGNYNPKMTNTALATVGAGTDYPLVSYRLGLPPPDSAMTVGHTGGASGANETRSYLFTYVTAFGEEGPPSPIGTYTAPVDATQWNLSAIGTAPLNTGSITAVSVASGVTTFTSAGHTLETGDYIDLSGITGTGDLPTTLNNAVYPQATRISTSQFSVPLAPTGTYTAGGTWTRESTINTTGMTKRIYRSSLGTYKFVAEIAVATTTYTDTVTEANLGEEIPGVDDLAWTSPNGDMDGIVMMAGGFAAGYYKNIVCFSPAYAPHAFPTGYEIALDYTIIKTIAIDNALIVLTTGQPYIITGYDPAAMTESKLACEHVCLSARGAAAVTGGVIYPSADGLVMVPVSGAPFVITRPWFDEKEWRELVPSSMISAVYDERFYAYYDTGTVSGVLVFDPNQPESTITTLNFGWTATFIDKSGDHFYFNDGGNIYQFAWGVGYESFNWRSKIFTAPNPCTMQSAQVRLTFGSALTAAEVAAARGAAIAALPAYYDSGAFAGYSPGEYTVAGGPLLAAVNHIESNTTLFFKLWVDEQLKYTKLVTDSKPFRLPSGYKSDTFEIELAGNNVAVHSVVIAESISELSQV